MTPVIARARGAVTEYRTARGAATIVRTAGGHWLHLGDRVELHATRRDCVAIIESTIG